jgi:hypothetical protein
LPIRRGPRVAQPDQPMTPFGSHLKHLHVSHVTCHVTHFTFHISHFRSNNTTISASVKSDYERNKLTQGSDGDHTIRDRWRPQHKRAMVTTAQETDGNHSTRDRWRPQPELVMTEGWRMLISTDRVRVVRDEPDPVTCLRVGAIYRRTKQVPKCFVPGKIRRSDDVTFQPNTWRGVGGTDTRGSVRNGVGCH